MTIRPHSEAQPGECPCIWMEAGVIDYWLCDRAFHCDACPLDMALRGRYPGHDAPVSRTPWVPPTTLFHRSHLWLNPIDDNEWAIGLDYHALHAFSKPPTLSLPRPGRRINQQDPLLSMLVDDDVLRWPAPMDVIVLERNDQWDTDANQLRECPFSDGWSLLVKLPRRLERSAWLDADAIQAAYTAERSALKDACLNTAKSDSALGSTAADGGMLTASPDQILSRPAYLAFLRQWWGLLSTESAF